MQFASNLTIRCSRTLKLTYIEPRRANILSKRFLKETLDDLPLFQAASLAISWIVLADWTLV